jgi:outer membrane protein assembly factor BamE (lipoprotein component of BamABCDE complex)
MLDFRVTAVCLVLGVAACTTTGKQLDPDAVAALKPGQTTYDDVIKQFGRPASEATGSTGVKVASYYWAHTAARPESFIPLIGPFVGGADTESALVMFQFDPAGKLTGITKNNSRMGTGTGLAGGTP